MTTARRCPVIGLVGGIGSGKSRVSAALARRGGRVVAGDPLGHEALRQPAVREKVIAGWEPGVLDAAGEIDRRKLGAVVFADECQRKALEAIVQPWIGERLREQIAAAQADPAVPFVVLDAAVMLEAGWEGACDVLVYVHAPRAVRLARVAAQRGWSPAEVAARERAQVSLTEKAARADVAVDNTGSLAELEPQLNALLASIGTLHPAVAGCGCGRVPV
ncbi:MAG TPA: dephospho-CoA kinase [Gemmataceae bacterium]|jgi:dephospho-CoA kinase